ncbi:sigma intracellular receptor 2-like [Haliotis rufescens]|uniref:sigma intracellular receptor 2-like n=1 Tax=Haliotis rufescens TaxID=6454 RepID=UPI001EAFA639|nr:sigma intracellular receptor 2-like [Haliotis rufescens]XP_046333090.1 sigma intracellular receptor 2-like [Haliotis rufescens]
MGLRTALDVVFCGYFVFQIPSTVLFDTQALFPSWVYPQWLKNMRLSYLKDFRDPYMADPSSFPWFMATCAVEFSLEIPYFFVAAYAYFYGARRCPWIRLPSLMYSVHTATSVLAIIFTTWLHDFTLYKVAGPRDVTERMRLICVYGFFFVVCVLNILDTCFSSAYNRDKEKTN